MDKIRITPAKVWGIAVAVVVLAGLALLLAWVSHGCQSVIGWHRFLLTEVISLAIAWAGFRLLKNEDIPAWLTWLVAGAVALRLATGIFWAAALPVWGYPNQIQQAGYVMFDPFLRDGDAWELAQSDEPLISAFWGYSPHDQYGGLLFLSALLYRTLGGNIHQPLLVVVVTSMASGMAVLFAWGFIQRLWGYQPAARLAAWGLALYPEAVLLGSSQMRGAFTISLGAALAYLVLRFYQERKRLDLLLIALLAAVTAAFTWAYLFQLAAVLGLLTIGLLLADIDPQAQSRWRKIGWAVLAGALLLTGGVLWPFLSSMNSYQTYLTERASGLVQAVLGRLPEFLHIPFVVSYGVVRPLLPAALMETGTAQLWQVVAIWRAIGWTVLLTLLVYATLTVIRSREWLTPAGMLMWGNWLIILVASFRAGGDLWDNPRYRAGFVVFQIALVVWALLQHQSRRTPLLRRLIVVVALMEIVITLWYASRYSESSLLAGRVETRVLIGMAIGMAYLLLDWLWEVWMKKERKP
ncbi:MAG: hypothetical protein JW757_05420 [Anaerolineales bacterium]|nr:hypothetical protein [Anaerolineales bacterium]